MSCSSGIVHVLIAEDNPTDVLIIREALRGRPIKFDVQVVDDGEKAIEFIERVEAADTARLDVLLLDLNLPRKTGLEVLERIRKSAKCAPTQVVIFSSSESPKDRHEAARLGATQYFRKPANLDEFLKIGDLVVEVAQRAGGRISSS